MTYVKSVQDMENKGAVSTKPAKPYPAALLPGKSALASLGRANLLARLAQVELIKVHSPRQVLSVFSRILMWEYSGKGHVITA